MAETKCHSFCMRKTMETTMIPRLTRAATNCDLIPPPAFDRPCYFE